MERKIKKEIEEKSKEQSLKATEILSLENASSKELDSIKEIDLENNKHNKYSWNCCYSLT